MARFAYFADLPDGTVLEWRDGSVPTYVDRMGCQRYRDAPANVGLFLPTFPTVGQGNALCGWLPGKGTVAITRKVELKSNPSRHDCDARCLNAKGRSMNCECSCGGRNHGRGAFVCEAA